MARIPRVDKSRITSRQATALTLRFERGWSFGKIGAAMGISRQGAYKLVQKALSNLPESIGR